MKRLITGLAAFTSLIVAAPAANASNYEFAYHPYELETAGGRLALYERIHRLSERVCGDNRSREMWRNRDRKECRDEVVMDLLAKIDDSRLYALANGDRRLAAN